MILTLTLSPSLDKTYIINGLIPDRLNYANKTITLPGSKGINVSRMLSNLKIETLAIGFCGGMFGEILKKKLKGENVKYKFVETESAIRFNTKIVDLSKNTFTDVNEIGKEVSSDELEELFFCYEQSLKKSQYVVIGGSVRQGMEENIYNEFLKIANKYNKKVLIDCSGSCLKQAIKEKPFLVTPNIHELSDFANKELKDDKQIIKELEGIIESGVKIAIATLGEKGAIMVDNTGIYKMTTPKVNTLNTTGAGDSFLAGVIYGLVNKFNSIEILKYAGALSTCKVTKEGTQMPDLEEALDIIERIGVEKLK